MFDRMLIGRNLQRSIAMDVVARDPQRPEPAQSIEKRESPARKPARASRMASLGGPGRDIRVARASSMAAQGGREGWL